MQLTLSTPPFAKPSVAPRSAPKAVRPRDEAVLSQLDQIAEQNLQASRHGLGASAMVLALVGGLVILGGASMWSTGDAPSRKPVAAVAEVRPAPAAQATVAAAPVLAAAAQTVTVVEPAAVPAAPEPTWAAAVAAEPPAAVDDAARKARAAKAAEAKRKAAVLAQERALAEETQRLQLAQQREAERAQQQRAEQAQQRAAAEQARLASVQLAVNTHRSVAEICLGAGNFVSQQFCRARECSKADHQGDAVCVRQRENELAQQRASSDR
jgi:type IV secretory pathway VirB10-like protein